MSTKKQKWNQLQVKEIKKKFPLQTTYFNGKHSGLRSSSSTAHFSSSGCHSNFPFMNSISNNLDLSFAQLLTKAPNASMQKRQKSCSKLNNNTSLSLSHKEQLDLSNQQRQLESIYLTDSKNHVSSASNIYFLLYCRIF